VQAGRRSLGLVLGTSLPLAGFLAVACLADRPAPAPRLSASAFAIAPGVLVTNAHVVERCRARGSDPWIADHAGPWRVAAEDAALDLALLAGPPDPTVPPLLLAAPGPLPRGAEVLVLGFPAGQAETDSVPSAALGLVGQAGLIVHDPQAEIAASFEALDRSGRPVQPTWADGVAYFGAANAGRLRWMLEIDVPVGPGESGAPVLDRTGAVAGVVFAGHPDQGPGLAVPLGDLRDFLDRAGYPALSAPVSVPLDWPDVERQAAPSVVRVAC
jgi:S1-C subfamily serine protease